MDQPIEFSSRASLVAVGLHFQQLNLWSIIGEQVHIKQKVLHYTPLDKLLDCFINILAGGTGLVEVNTRVRPDRAVQVAFGRVGCADQSTISDTLNACTAENVDQWRVAFKHVLRRYGKSYRHDYERDWQLLDVDVTGMPAGRLGEGVTKGYFAQQKNRRGRQLGRVLATWYDEIVVDRLYTGKRQLDHSLKELVLTAEEALDLKENKRKRTIIRVDSGGGDDDNVDWLLARGYHLLGKIKNWRRAAKLAATVTHWHIDPKMPDREVGWVEAPHPYAKPTSQVAIRKRKANGEWSYHVLVFNLTLEMLCRLCHQPLPAALQHTDEMWMALYAYDRRGGGLETQTKGDKQGLSLSRRNKHRFAAQEMLVLLAQLAHNLIIWTRNDLATADQRLQKYGIQRTLRDVLQIDGHIQLNAHGQVEQIVLNARHPLAPAFQKAFSSRLARDDLSLILGQI